MKLVTAALAGALLTAPAALAQPPAADPFIWLEDIDSPKAMAWVEAQNARTAKRLEGDARYQTFLTEGRAIFTATDRIPKPDFRAGGVDNFWQDATNTHGVWRHASLASYRMAAPAWEVTLDIDKLAKDEGRNWFWKGATCLKPDETLCLVRLSNGGGDAVELREFDTRTRTFVEGGFRSPEGKQGAEWVDRDTLVAWREWTPGEVTASGYANVVKILKRSGEATEIFRGQKSDVWANAAVLRGEAGRTDGVLIQRGLTFFESEYSLYVDGKLTAVALPKKAQFQAYVDGRMVFTLQEAWNGFGSGALIAYDPKDLAAKPALVFQPGPRQAIQAVADTKGLLAVELLEDVKGAVDVYDLKDGKWTARRLALPKGETLSIISTSGRDDQLFVGAEGFLTPSSLWLADGATGKAEKLKSLPARFDASKDQVDQFWATSSDGTQIPYFVVRPKGAKLDGGVPTIMYGYGGFEVAKPPIYIPEMGKIWLERGGAYVIANIRGGGEFGPAWHQSVLREKRQLAFDDFAAVARDLEARKITSARRLGIYGRSNGGVLTTVSMTQHPELWKAVVVESPLVDMLRYHKLSAGASWVGEYGDPDVPEDHAFIARYDGYLNLKPGQKYPEPYITTNTRDDRVHPGHARKFAAKMEQLGYPYLYFENTFGGHSNDADPEMNAKRWARHYVYLAQKLMD
ncbi:prolyl oligopeptidase [Phenylobacterium sp. Root77]|uniref:prolyl oligopeptidase family serine peptidase n=1 Tax=unclassified Phenylobacterium TaxID=2640670 RepID=UPI0006F71AAD|nr:MULTISPECIES: prolyl oligopeptidase family serine peptidase [unclassified Phenylobacterium]KQW65944.1 prolyl oligopeptidase [Phenylobacterium sp. Root1277]KQW95653.1 prolyl oligopeptidase [Phenylobacterium sp. Root1290]KRC41442.1 prolyl oligopeptidase [Phenylobacterium sp. Root77]